MVHTLFKASRQFKNFREIELNLVLLDQPSQLPTSFVDRMSRLLGAEWVAFESSLRNPSPVSVRLNPNKIAPTLNGGVIPWCEHGLYLLERPVFTLDPHLHAGAYYVQEASSMFLEQALRTSVDLTKPLRVLDACAAPGGKSTHLLSLINHESLLVSNEVIRSRASILAENIQKWGKPNVVVTNSDPEHIGRLAGFFDVIVVDAPCSGEGLFRKDAAAIAEWSDENANLCTLRQRRILSELWPALKEDGILIYCTCTFNPNENEENLSWFADQVDAEFLSVPCSFEGPVKRVADRAIGYQFYPHRVTGEGFFLSVIRKRSKTEIAKSRKPITEKPSKLKVDWLVGDFTFYQFEDLLVAVPSAVAEDIQRITTTLNPVIRGVSVATVMRNKLIPEHALGLSTALVEGAFPVEELSKSEALTYLAKDTLVPKTDERGFALMSFEGNKLGFVNRLGNRINNLYPSSWRIRMDVRGASSSS